MVDPAANLKLHAILAADVAGYSRLMQHDDRATVRTLEEYRAVFRDLTESHRGRVVDMAGDSVLAVFESATAAVEAAIEIQSLLAKRNEAHPEARRMRFRIGINLGEVIENADGTVYGDGVNVAARLQSIGEPGGVTVSGIVFDQVKNRLQVRHRFAGNHEVKNIAGQIKVYHLAQSSEAPTDRARGLKRAIRSRSALAAMVAILAVIALATIHSTRDFKTTPSSPSSNALPLPDRPSIAVLPFVNMSEDPKQEYFSDGMTESIITSLSKRPGLFVIARNSTFTYKGRAVKPEQVSRELGVRYVLEGSVQKAANRVRITAQLIDGTTGYHIWAERYDAELKDIFALQDDITQKIVMSASPKFALQLESSAAKRAETNNVEAYDLVLRAIPLINEVRHESMVKADEMLQRAVAHDPNYARAYAMMTWFYFNDWWFQWTPNHASGLDRAFGVASKAVRMDPTVSDAHVALGWTLVWRREHDAAIAEIEKAIELDPNNYDAYALYTEVLNFSGQPEKGIEAAKNAMRLDPNFPFYVTFNLGNSYYSLRRYDEAIAAYKEVLHRNPEWAPAYSQLAAIYAELGHEKEARAQAEKFRRLDPGTTTNRLKQHLPFKNKRELERLISAWRRAGLE